MKKTHCKRFHERTTDNVNKHGDCRKCKREWNKAHREEIAVYERSYRLKNREAVNARGRENSHRYRVAHPEKIAAINKANYRAHRDANIARSIKWQKENPRRHLDAKLRYRRRSVRWQITQALRTMCKHVGLNLSGPRQTRVVDMAVDRRRKNI